MKHIAPVFFFSLRSPYSWLAWHDLKTQHPTLLEQLELKPFWEPDADYQGILGNSGEAFLYTAMSKDKHLYILSDVKRLATRRGMSVHWPIDKAPVWEVPHLAWYVAQAAGQGRAYIEAITDMRWKHGRNICDPATVEEVGHQLGLDGAVLRDAHLNPGIRQQGLAALQDCIRGGVFGVPYFVLGRQKFWGLDRLTDFIDAVSQGGHSVNPVQTTASVPNRAIEDHAGGCG